jgi:catechol 2,3-dioxygenase-like lactoylglutathione lyase family enzyme
MITNLDHVVLAVSDFEAATNGYEALLGRQARRTDPANGAVRAWFRMSNISLEIIAPAGAGVAGDRVREQLDAHGEGLSLLAFGVDNVEVAQRWLGRRGVGVRPVVGSFNALAADPATTHGQPMVFARFEDHARAPAIGDEAAAMEGVDHVVIHTPDPERAVALYGGRLGLDLRLDRANPQWGTRLLFFRLGGLVIEIAHTMKDGVGAGPDTLGGLAWRARDVEEAHARLLLAGFSVSDIRTGRRPGSKVFTVRDKTFGVPTLVLSVEPRED